MDQSHLGGDRGPLGSARDARQRDCGPSTLEASGLRETQGAEAAALGRDKDRDQQFQNIARLRAESEGSPNPIVSLDTKKKELIGNFSRDGQLDTLKTLRTLDHDFPSVAEGVILPHGLYDVKRNHGHINLGVSHDTSQFACDSIYRWWPRHGHLHDPSATSVLLLCDGGGSNAANRSVFKAALQGLANRMGIAIRIAQGRFPKSGGCTWISIA